MPPQAGAAQFDKRDFAQFFLLLFIYFFFLFLFSLGFIRVYFVYEEVIIMATFSS